MHITNLAILCHRGYEIVEKDGAIRSLLTCSCSSEMGVASKRVRTAVLSISSSTGTDYSPCTDIKLHLAVMTHSPVIAVVSCVELYLT